jgi:hypothetical protein
MVGDEFCSFGLTGASMAAQSVMLNGFSFGLSDLSPHVSARVKID